MTRAPTAEPLFRFEDVRVERGGDPVLDGVDLDLPDGGVTVVVGPTGSGKSTLVRLCNRLIDPTAGVVRFRGRDLRDLDVIALRREVGLVLQRPTPFPGSVAHNLEVARRAPVSRDDVAAALERVGLPAVLAGREDVTTLSGGQAQLLCIARTLEAGPRVLIADEPTSSVDEATTAQVEALARRLVADGTPVVWITHDLAQMRRLGGHLVVLARGGVVAAGPSAAVAGVAEAQLRSGGPS